MSISTKPSPQVSQVLELRRITSELHAKAASFASGHPWPRDWDEVNESFKRYLQISDSLEKFLEELEPGLTRREISAHEFGRLNAPEDK